MLSSSVGNAIGGVIGTIILIIVAIILLSASIRTVEQANVAVVTMFGKYRRVLNPGLNFVIPFF
jgi:regulator of protease activity HflC (stomatin/prohibitin superfamily)